MFWQEMSTHVLEVLTHENIILKSRYKVSTRRIKLLTPEDSEQSLNVRI